LFKRWVYPIDGETVFVLHISHGRRQPIKH
jgi:hypothetical protein